ncbi:hypothetical protein H8356DRAFT_1420180 [Neocallimastix lanati (nom. inval.)]|nr:hypothetical protein H8356DRAFT_1420180 [Neocallimastix sp. JGI-2020a]
MNHLRCITKRTLVGAFFISNTIVVTLAEWLTRWPAKPFPFGSAGSSPAGYQRKYYPNFFQIVNSNSNSEKFQNVLNIDVAIPLIKTMTNSLVPFITPHCNEGFTMEENTQIEEINIQNKTEYLGNWKRK